MSFTGKMLLNLGVYLNECLNPYLTNGLSHYYHLGESTFILRGICEELQVFIKINH